MPSVENEGVFIALTSENTKRTAAWSTRTANEFYNLNGCLLTSFDRHPTFKSISKVPKLGKVFGGIEVSMTKLKISGCCLSDDYVHISGYLNIHGGKDLLLEEVSPPGINSVMN